MSYADVWTALRDNLLFPLVGVPPDPSYVLTGWPGIALGGVIEGEPLSLPIGPIIMLVNEDVDRDPRRPSEGLERNSYHIVGRLAHQYQNDQANAELVLMPFLEQITRAWAAGIKLGSPVIVNSEIRRGQWGYLFVNNILYRTFELHFYVDEKVTRQIVA